MGLAGAVIGGGILGLGLAAATAKKPSFSMPTETHSQMAVTKPAAPAAPVAEAGSGNTAQTGNMQMETEREREKQAALLRKQQSPEVLTSGLGASGMAETAKKTLLGG